jgi:hypothetical protein
LEQHMRKVGIFFLVFGAVSAVFAIRSTWRNYQFMQASTLEEASVDSVYIKPIRSALSSISYTLRYMGEDSVQLLQHKVTKHHTIHDPLPSLEELKSSKFYIRYVPRVASSNAGFSDWVLVRDHQDFSDMYAVAHIFQAISMAAIGALWCWLGRKRREHRSVT